ncbi:fungal-specific transcription factor domain-containing protein [Coniochaeta sp. 2T2.1]|nr:fungal-specific transcription factor domain-containing protein [Coniochaeta sp. 2T2.1]
MPRRRKADAANTPVQKRARTGCLTCRTRKVKCDETKPRCKQCERRGLTCQTGIQLKWEQEFSSRGLAFGRQGRWSKDRTPGSPATPTSVSLDCQDPVEWCALPLVRPHHFINTFYYDFDLDSCKEGPDEEGPGEAAVGESLASSIDTLGLLQPEDIFVSPTIAPATTTTLTLSRSPSPFPSLFTVDSKLLEYYLLRLCPLTTPSKLASSPFAQLIVPLFGSAGQEDVQQAVMALSARHRSKTDTRWSKTAMALKGGVIASLRRRLLTADNMIWDPQILIIMMFLCLYEIVDNCDHRWVIHLRASEDIIRRSRQIPAPHVYGDFGQLTTFTERFFAFQDVISRTACGNSPLFGVEYWDYAAEPGDIDGWMGCSPSLVKILCRITELSRVKSRGKISPGEFEEQSAGLERELDEMRQVDALEEGDTLASAAELKRKSILLYHHCVLYDAGPSTPFVSESVREILEGLRDLVRAGVTAALAFPVFVAAVELDPVDDQLFYDTETGEPVHGRRLVLETLEEIGRSSLSNISRTRAVIQKVWRSRDMALDEETPPHKRRGKETNDWSFFVGPYSSNISLA